jgi:DnaJ-class molecular chaperone
METQPCQPCRDSGKCRRCNGSGSTIEPQRDAKGVVFRRVPCEACDGSGKCLSCQLVYPEAIPAAWQGTALVELG